MFRAEVIGSMLRPSYLKEGRAAFEQGQLSAADFKRLEDRAVDQVIAMQEGAGVDVVSDGEMRRFLFMGPITETVEGIEFVEHDSAMPWSTPEGDIEWTSPAAVTSKLRKRRSMVTEEYSYARARARLPLKVTVPSPLVLYGLLEPEALDGRLRRRRSRCSPTPPRSGARRSRSSSRSAASTSRSTRPSSPRSSTRASATGPSRSGSAPSACSPRGSTSSTRWSRASPACAWASICAAATTPGMWMASGGYDYIAQALFERATAFDAFFLEYDDARSGSFEPLAGAPDDKQVVLGLVSTKTPALETPRGAARADRRGRALLPARPARALDAVRLRLDRRRQPDHRGRRGAQAAPRRRHGARRLGLGRAPSR